MNLVWLLVAIIMLRNCPSGCRLTHAPPYGSRCKTVLAMNAMEKTLDERMAAAGFTDPKYLEYMEQEVLKTIESKAEEASTMQRLIDRLDDIESREKVSEDCLMARLDKIELSRQQLPAALP